MSVFPSHIREQKTEEPYIQTLPVYDLRRKEHNTSQYQHASPLIPFLSPKTIPNPVYCNPFEFYTHPQLLSSCITRGMFKTVAVEFDWRSAFLISRKGSDSLIKRSQNKPNVLEESH